MTDYLVFQLYGSLAAWGEIAVGETRHSAFAPAKSAVLGLLAAALGLRRPDTTGDEAKHQDWETRHIALADGYGMAVKLTLPGSPITDYHTAEVPKGTGFATRRDEIIEVMRQKRSGTQFKGTILSRRDYRQDAFAALALWAREGAPYPLEHLRDKLLEPEFVLYLGRKSCPPALPLAPRLVPAETVEDALAGCAFSNAAAGLWQDEQAAGWLAERLGGGPAILLWDADAETRITAEQTVSRRDTPSSRRRWQFAMREERRAHLAPGGKS